MALSCTSYIHKSVYVHTWPLCVTHTCPGHTGSPRQRPQSLGKPSHSKHLCLKAAQFMSCQCWGVSQKSHPVCWEMLHSPGRAGSWWCLGGLGGAHSPLQLHAEPLEGIQVTAVTPWDALGLEHPSPWGCAVGPSCRQEMFPSLVMKCCEKRPCDRERKKFPKNGSDFFLLPFVIETELQQIVLVCKCQVYCSLKSLQS